MRHSAIFSWQPHVHDSSRINLNAASLRAPLIPCQSTPGYSGAVCHDSWPKQSTPRKRMGAKFRILTLLLSPKGLSLSQPSAVRDEFVPLVILSPALWLLLWGQPFRAAAGL